MALTLNRPAIMPGGPTDRESDSAGAVGSACTSRPSISAPVATCSLAQRGSLGVTSGAAHGGTALSALYNTTRAAATDLQG